jgi:hypothetical protein
MKNRQLPDRMEGAGVNCNSLEQGVGERNFVHLDVGDLLTGTLVSLLSLGVDLENQRRMISPPFSSPCTTTASLTKVGASSGLMFFPLASAIFILVVECTAASAGLALVPPVAKR